MPFVLTASYAKISDDFVYSVQDAAPLLPEVAQLMRHTARGQLVAAQTYPLYPEEVSDNAAGTEGQSAGDNLNVSSVLLIVHLY